MRRADTDAERQALAKRLAPLPGDPPAGRQPLGLMPKSTERAIEYEAKRRRDP
jgi:hypothetical protein